MGRFIGFLYGVVNYVVFFLVFLYLAVFVGNLTFIGDYITLPFAIKTVDVGGPMAGSTMEALFINFLLLALFSVQHSVMARPGFKKKITQIVPQKLERSTYILFTNLLLILLYWQWRPMTGGVWDLTGGVGEMIMWGGFALGWLLILMSTLLIDHFELFGLTQAINYLRGKDMKPYKFVTPLLYKVVRHPLYLGWLLAFWCAPVMSQGHLFLAAVWTVYIFIAISYEEKDLLAYFGKKYADYRAKTPMIFPFVKFKK